MSAAFQRTRFRGARGAAREPELASDDWHVIESGGDGRGRLRQDLRRKRVGDGGASSSGGGV